MIEDPESMQACSMMYDKMESKIRKRGRPGWRAVFYVERKDNNEKLSDKLVPVKARQKKGWSTTEGDYKKSSLMLVPQKEEEPIPED